MYIQSNHRPEAMQSLQRQYAENAILPSIDWQSLSAQQQLTPAQITALDTIYQSAIPLALTVFKRLNFDVFAPAAFHPQGLGLFDQLAKQEERFIDILNNAAEDLDHDTRHQIWSMLLRGGAVLVFKVWLGLVKTGQLGIDLVQFDELSDLLWIKTKPDTLAKALRVDSESKNEHLFLIYEDSVYLDRFNCLETALLFSQLGVYDPVFLSMQDEQVAQFFIEKGLVTEAQIDELECAMNPLNCADQRAKQDYLV
ncbi:hypothetical protein [Acinetobacter sp.]|uniref:hypothetical protein n=1 Tax=Acinetobacter sp. TaxID=472 RepID=UPI0035B084C4